MIATPSGLSNKGPLTRSPAGHLTKAGQGARLSTDGAITLLIHNSKSKKLTKKLQRLLIKKPTSVKGKGYLKVRREGTQN
jgi:hypothetical protein